MSLSYNVKEEILTLELVEMLDSCYSATHHVLSSSWGTVGSSNTNTACSGAQNSWVCSRNSARPQSSTVQRTGRIVTRYLVRNVGGLQANDLGRRHLVIPRTKVLVETQSTLILERASSSW